MRDVDADFAARNPKTALYHALASTGSTIERTPSRAMNGRIIVGLDILNGESIETASTLGLELIHAKAVDNMVKAVFEVTGDGE